MSYVHIPKVTGDGLQQIDKAIDGHSSIKQS